MTSPPETRAARASFADRYRVLLDIGRTLTGTLSTEDLFRAIYRETARILEAPGFYISLYDGEQDLATAVFYADRGEERRSEITYTGSESEVIRTGRACMIEDRSRIDSLLVLGDEEGAVTRSAICAPLRYKGRVVGAISAQSYRAASYSEDDLELLQGIADIAAVAIENARYVSEIKRRQREAEQIEEIGRAVAASLETGDVLRKVIAAALDLLSVDGSTVWFLQDGSVATVEASEGDTEPPEGFTWELTDEMCETLMDERAPFVIEDVRSCGAVPPDLAERFESGSGVIVPLVVEDRVVGALSVGSREKRAFSEDDVRILFRLANQASVALENARLHSYVQALSLTDPLTEIPNRRHLEIHLEIEVAAARRGRSLSAVLFDLDNFKRYNDALGHQAGDRILEAFGRILKEEARSMNLIARYGGDEFISILTDTTIEGAESHAQRVTGRVRRDPDLSPHGITVSYGIATFAPGMDEGDDLIRAADEALYRAKKRRLGSGGRRTASP